jgi:hypothetical protein
MPETRFTKAGDIDIAYQVIGPADGLDLVFVPGWVSHLEVMWELPEFARFLDRLAAMGRLGKATLVPVIAPSRVDDARFLSWYRRWERQSSTPSAAAATLRWAMEFNLGPVLPAIQARTLILHRTGNALIDLDSVRAAAELIPDATYAEFPGADDLPYLGDTDALLDAIQEFLTGTPGSPDTDRSLATVMFTDIVGSTHKADDLGDRRWRFLLEEHHAPDHRRPHRCADAPAGERQALPAVAGTDGVDHPDADVRRRRVRPGGDDRRQPVPPATGSTTTRASSWPSPG